MHKYKDLKIWNKAIDLVVDVYQATSNFPKEENTDSLLKSEEAQFQFRPILPKGQEEITIKNLFSFWQYQMVRITN